MECRIQTSITCSPVDDVQSSSVPTSLHSHLAFIAEMNGEVRDQIMRLGDMILFPTYLILLDQLTSKLTVLTNFGHSYIEQHIHENYFSVRKCLMTNLYQN